jgi:D-amino peptidase
MKILISADMEGTCGVVSWVQVTPPELARTGQSGSTVEYERARLRMTREVNAAVEGAFAAGADEVVVNDSHDGMRNLVNEELHPRARYISGFDKPHLMMQGIAEEGVSAVFFTGYHARAGTPDGPLAHSFTGWVHDIRMNGISMGEYGVNALTAGHFGVPVALATGDEAAVAQIRGLLGEQVIGVAVKRGYSVTAAINEHPERAQQLIRAGADRALRELERLQPFVMPAGAVFEIDFDHQSRAAQAESLPGCERAGWRTLRFAPANGVELQSWLRLIIGLAANPPS